MMNRTFPSFFLLPERVMSLKDYNGPLMNSKSQASTFTLHYRFLTLDFPVEWSGEHSCLQSSFSHYICIHTDRIAQC